MFTCQSHIARCEVTHELWSATTKANKKCKPLYLIWNMINLKIKLTIIMDKKGQNGYGPNGLWAGVLPRFGYRNTPPKGLYKC